MTTEVRQWLEALGMSQYADAFEANDVTAELLPRLSDQVLKDIGVASAGHRLRMLDTISRPAVLAGGSPYAELQDKAKPGSSYPSDGERRQATILVADISGYTALCGRLDAEQVQAMLSQFYDVTDRIIANYGGQVTINNGGVLEGTIYAKAINIEKGGVFSGELLMNTPSEPFPTGLVPLASVPISFERIAVLDVPAPSILTPNSWLPESRFWRTTLLNALTR